MVIDCFGGQVPFQIRGEGDAGEVLALALFDARLVFHTHVVLKFLGVVLLIFRIVRLNDELPVW